MAANRYPKLVAFDLEYAWLTLRDSASWLSTLHHYVNYSYTLWDLWIDTHVSGLCSVSIYATYRWFICINILLRAFEAHGKYYKQDRWQVKHCPSPSQKEEENLGNRNKIRSSHRVLQRCSNNITSSQVRWGQNSSMLKDKCSSTVGHHSHSCAFENPPKYNAILYLQCSASIVSSTRPSFQGRATGATKASNWIFWSAGNLSRLAHHVILLWHVLYCI